MSGADWSLLLLPMVHSGWQKRWNFETLNMLNTRHKNTLKLYFMKQQQSINDVAPQVVMFYLVVSSHR